MPATHSNLPLWDDRDRAWDKDAALGRVRKWASSDGSGDKDKMDWGKYRRAFLWAGDSPEDFGDFKLPMGDMDGDTLKAVWKGVTAAEGRLSGTDIDDKDAVQDEIDSYYRKAAKLFKDDSIKPKERAIDLEEFQRAFGEFGGVERRYAHVAGLETRDNGDPDSLFSATGRAIVFDSYSLDLGGFKEEIDPGAVRDALAAEDADYHLLWDHDTTLVLARNRNKTLAAEIVDGGVDFWARVANTSYAADLRVLMDRKDVDECSFAFTIADGGEEWRRDADGTIVRRVTKIDRLWDLTICARGAYPATHSASVRSAVAAIAAERAGLPAEFPEVHNPEVDAETRALTPGMVAWDDEQGYWDVACDLECLLQTAESDRTVYWWTIDVNVRDGGTEGLFCRYNCGTGEADYVLITGITYDEREEPVLPESEPQPVETAWVAVESDEDDPDEVAALVVLEAKHNVLGVARAMERDPMFAAYVSALRSNNGAVTEDGVEDTPDEGTPDAPAVENDTDDDVEGKRPTTNEDEDDRETSPTDEEADESRKLAIAKARARGRAVSLDVV